MNTLSGTAYPNTSKWRGSVEASIKGVIVAGDQVDDGCAMFSGDDPGCEVQWDQYTRYFKVNPDPSDPIVCRYPALEGMGNHDGGNSTDKKTGLVRRGVIERNRQRALHPAHAGYESYSTSTNGLHSSWDWGGVHFAMLGVYPGTEGDCATPGLGNPGRGCCAANQTGDCWGWHSPEHSLEFLKADLAEQERATPIVLFMHYGLRGFGSPGGAPWAGYSPDFWWEAEPWLRPSPRSESSRLSRSPLSRWSAREARAFADAIAAHNIVAIVHGHTHACVFYQW